jgi:hypothetical protein
MLQVVCTGHSLGAALATLCGTWAATTYPTADVRVANFGSPFVGNQAYINVRGPSCCLFVMSAKVIGHSALSRCTTGWDTQSSWKMLCMVVLEVVLLSVTQSLSTSYLVQPLSGC